MAVTFGCNEAAHRAPIVTVDPLKDTIILKSQNGYHDAASGSYLDLYGISQYVHATPTDSGFFSVNLDTALAATNYHLNMHLSNLKTNGGKFDIKFNCMMTMAPNADSNCMFVAQCNNGSKMVFDTVNVNKDNKNFTLHITNADASYYYIVMWSLNHKSGSTVSIQDIWVTAAK